MLWHSPNILSLLPPITAHLQLGAAPSPLFSFGYSNIPTMGEDIVLCFIPTKLSTNKPDLIHILIKTFFGKHTQ
jgi:hypothetical protein